MEYIDVLDENGVKTGEILSRREIHKRGLWHRAIVVAVINEKNEILLQQRSMNKDKNPGLWDISVAGHVSAGQDAISAAVREIYEEILNSSDLSALKSSCIISAVIAEMVRLKTIVPLSMSTTTAKIIATTADIILVANQTPPNLLFLCANSIMALSSSLVEKSGHNISAK